MAADWIAPAATAASGCAGIFFTWLTGAQSRKQVEQMAMRSAIRDARERSLDERRNAYLVALRMQRLDIQRLEYQQGKELGKLEEVERTWPKGERVRMSIESKIAIEAFGSTVARDNRRRAVAAYVAQDLGEMRSTYDEFLAVVRMELGTAALDS
ncbi:hypothetical protein [Paractinoplanes lichenicola]|uniref:Uncharacterized protein n=1 Tax=Paractinoplanes lichenicola TaxID=2802976 RepID=A0ABS1W1M3_9ACTN|nr:hypothetical protein [Actinoplanes lichenicola]MBL7260641.1 hypothetical protein [Actinoplanes lichenicola]